MGGDVLGRGRDLGGEGRTTEWTPSAQFLPHQPTNQLRRRCSNMKALASRLPEHNVPQFPKLSNRMIPK